MVTELFLFCDVSSLFLLFFIVLFVCFSLLFSCVYFLAFWLAISNKLELS